MSTSEKSLAINGGVPVRKTPVIIHKPAIHPTDIEHVSKAVESTFVSGDGPACREFEKNLATYLGVKHALFLTSCTTALDLAFMAREFAPDSEVIVPDFTYTSSALGPLLNKLKIVLADVDPDNGNLDPAKLEQYITKKTVAVVPVDYAGNPADMDAINAIARKHDLYVVHDTAQSIGSLYHGKKTGNQAAVSTFSFHGTKNMTTGEGGAIVTDDDELAAKIKIMREKGTDKYSFLSDNTKKGYYEYISLGNSYVQSNILGALGLSQLRKLDENNARRAQIADYYIRELSGNAMFSLPKITENSKSNWHIFYLLVPAEHRFWILDALNAEGIMANVHYTPLHRNKYYQDLGTDADFPGAMRFYGRLIRIPIYPSLLDDEMRDVVTAVKKVFLALSDH
ncbi:MAG: DegT/DnrJ/EryC1/StrS aminotransferase family protein [Bacteroidetes bacterium]|nr:DegT/DnrJ/EryC1/StrS aminotransferase family protein [Bacteroidota bacterium]